MDRAYANSIPYASMLARVGNSETAFLVLGETYRDQLHWFAADRSAIVTRGPFVARTVGLPDDVTYTEFVTLEPASFDLLSAEARRPHVRLVDIKSQGIYSSAIQSTFTPAGEETVVILEQSYRLVRIQEEVHAKRTDVRYRNTYWVDPQTRICWKSEQRPAPEIEAFTFEILTPYAGA